MSEFKRKEFSKILELFIENINKKDKNNFNDRLLQLLLEIKINNINDNTVIKFINQDEVKNLSKNLHPERWTEYKECQIDEHHIPIILFENLILWCVQDTCCSIDWHYHPFPSLSIFIKNKKESISDSIIKRNSNIIPIKYTEDFGRNNWKQLDYIETNDKIYFLNLLGLDPPHKIIGTDSDNYFYRIEFDMGQYKFRN